MSVNSSVKVKDWLKKSASRLEKAGIGSANLDVLILLEDALGSDRSQILAHPEQVISKSKLKQLDSKLKRREKHLPLAVIRGFSEFYGRRFYINRHVLEPRPESESMIDLLVRLPLPANVNIADVGTGSGALGITAALELDNDRIDLYDIDASAIAVARHNLELHELNLKVFKRDLLSRTRRHYQVIMANLPYVPLYYQINQAAAMEPRIAINGGSDGLEVYRRLFTQLSDFTWKPKFIFTESLPPQHEELARIAYGAEFLQLESSGLVQLFKSRA